MARTFKAVPVEIKEVDEEQRSFLAVASTEDIDRDNDRIMADGWNLDNFKTNPVVPWAHRYGDPPVAQATDVFVDRGKLMFRPKFATADEYPFADTIFKLYKGGFLRTFSVGFDPKRYEIVEREKGRRGYDFLEQELWEISACTVPSNPNALVAAKTKGVIGEEEFEEAEKAFEAGKKEVSRKDAKDAKEEEVEAEGSITVTVENQAETVTLDPNTPGPDAGKTATEKRLEALEDMAQGMGFGELKEEIAALREEIAGLREAQSSRLKAESEEDEPEPEGAESEEHEKAETLSLSKAEVVEALGEVLDKSLGRKLDGIIKQKLNAALGIVE